MVNKSTFVQRDISWLSFNARVLQEANDPTVPISQRIRFLGIFSNNMDEFFRVRVANLRRLILIGEKKVDGFEGTPKELYLEIRSIVLKQQNVFEKVYQKILEELSNEGIVQLDENNLNESQKKELYEFFNIKLKHEIVPIILDSTNPFPRLKDYAIYLAIKMVTKEDSKEQYALIQIPHNFPRFYRLKDDGQQKYFILLDDIIRVHLPFIFSIFTFDSIEAHTFKFTRDAELDLDDDTLIDMSIIVKFAAGEMSGKLSAKYKFDIPDNFNYLISKKISN